jgi:hypothetical protein
MLKLGVSLRRRKIHAPKQPMRQGDQRIAQQGIGTYPLKLIWRCPTGPTLRKASMEYRGAGR